MGRIVLHELSSLSRETKGLTLKLPTLGSGNIELKYEHKPMQTGLKTVDSLVPMYYGKRELIIGGLTN